MWIDIACIVFTCVSANHLGLVKAIEEVCNRELPIVNCVKCSTFWSVLIYTYIVTHDIIAAFAISFLASYIAIWLELIEGTIDFLYTKIYEKIYPDTENDTLTAAGFEDDTNCSVS